FNIKLNSRREKFVGISFNEFRCVALKFGIKGLEYFLEKKIVRADQEIGAPTFAEVSDGLCRFAMIPAFSAEDCCRCEWFFLEICFGNHSIVRTKYALSRMQFGAPEIVSVAAGGRSLVANSWMHLFPASCS